QSTKIVKNPIASILEQNKLTEPNFNKCYHCGKIGHWKRNCKEYLASLKSSGIYFVEVNLSVNDSSWVLDTGCGSHICNDLQMMARRNKLENGETILRMGNGAKVVAKAIGTVYLTLNNDVKICLTNCLYVSDVIRNIISIPVMDREGFKFVIENGRCSIFKDKTFIYSGNLTNGLYTITPQSPILTIQQNKRKFDNHSSFKIWHARLGHISEKKIHKLGPKLDLRGEERLPTCESCLKGKMTKSPFVEQVERAKGLLDLIHTDVCGPLNVSAKGNYYYFITFIDDYSRYGYVYLLRYKSEVFEKFKEFRNEVEKQIGRSIEVLRSDRGGEYLTNEFLDYLRDNGIISQWTPPGTPQLNGVSERRNRTLLDMVRSMMSSTSLPLSFWGYALETATHILNRVLRIKIYRDRFKKMIRLSQSTYINKVLKRFSIEESKRGHIPMSHGVSLSKTMSPKTPEERERMSHIPYASAIGSIMYAMLYTRPDVAYALS
ncbi:Unknown protein, partial [Striga hermonthica]